MKIGRSFSNLLSETAHPQSVLTQLRVSLSKMRAPQVEADVGIQAVVGHDAEVPEVHGIIPWQQLDNIVGLDLPAVPIALWQPWM